MAAESASPLHLAWLRLRANRLAMASLGVVALMALAVATAPWFGLADPDLAHHWLGAQPPGAERPLIAERNRFRLGEPAEAPPELRTAARLELRVDERQVEEWRVVLSRRGTVRQIMRKVGAEVVERLAPPAAGAEPVELREDGSEVRSLVPAALAVGQPPPPGWFAPDQQVLFLGIATVAPAVRWEVALADGVVTALTRDGVARPALELRGEQVRTVVADGRERAVRHWLGTDAKGRDLLARTLWGGRISLLVGLVATAVSLVIGVLVGAVSGYAGGRTDRLVMGGVDVLYAVPFMFLVILLLTVFGRSFVLLFVALGAVQWLTMARIVRGQVLSLAGREFVQAARLGGAGHWRIIHRHLIPNALGPVIVYATLTVPAVILQESFLAFLGLGVGFADRQVESWGALVSQGAQAMHHWWLLVVPATAMSVTLLALNALGDGLRDAFDPRMEGR